MDTPIAERGLDKVAEQYRKMAEHHVRHYRTDLDYDCEFIVQGKPSVFAVREMGSHAVVLDKHELYPKRGERVPYPGSADRDHILQQKTAMLDAVAPAALAWFYFDGYVVTQIMEGRARSIVSEYTANMQRIFDAEEVLGNEYS